MIRCNGLFRYPTICVIVLGYSFWLLLTVEAQLYLKVLLGLIIFIVFSSFIYHFHSQCSKIIMSDNLFRFFNIFGKELCSCRVTGLKEIAVEPFSSPWSTVRLDTPFGIVHFTAKQSGFLVLLKLLPDGFTVKESLTDESLSLNDLKERYLPKK